MATVTDCPRKILPPDIHDYMRLWKFTNKGLLPRAGGLMDQTQNYLDMCEALDVFDRIARDERGIDEDDE